MNRAMIWRWCAPCCVVLLVVVLNGCSRTKPSGQLTSAADFSSSADMADSGIGAEGERVEDRLAGGGEGGPLDDVYFAYDSYDLSSEARNVLQRNAEWMRGNAQTRVEVEGHCDERGTAEYNLALGAKRANSAKYYLVNLGIPSERLSTISYGEELPVCSEPTESCWQRNRRAHFLPTTR